LNEETPGLTVECYAGYRGEETPRRFELGGRVVELERVLERWLEPDRRWFKVRARDGSTHVLCQDRVTGGWRLVSSEPL
jgi:hypothetical protein